MKIIGHRKWKIKGIKKRIKINRSDRIKGERMNNNKKSIHKF
jgi:hypothetical protein